MQTEEPFWLADAYAQAITGSDLGLVQRNLTMAMFARVVLCAFFDRGDRCFDYGCGYGLLVRLMRDAGYNFYGYDRYCQNLFAAGFEVDPGSGGRYELVTAFEVLEHLTDPLSAMEAMLGLSDSVLCTTLLIGDPPPPLTGWWYYGLEHGQHVIFYTRATLQRIAARFGVRLVTNGHSLHLFTARQVSPILFRLVTRSRLVRWADRFCHRPSLLPRDYYTVTGQTLSG